MVKINFYTIDKLLKKLLVGKKINCKKVIGEITDIEFHAISKKGDIEMFFKIKVKDKVSQRTILMYDEFTVEL